MINLPDFDCAFATGVSQFGRPIVRFVGVFTIDNVITTQSLFRLCKRTIGRRQVSVAEMDTLCSLWRTQTAGGFKEVLRIRGRSLDSAKPGIAETFATETEGANGIAFDKNGYLYVTGGRSGRIYRTGPEGGQAQVFAQIAPHTRILPDGKTEQALTANGIVFDKQGTTLYIADTARGAIWKLAIGTDGQAGQPALMTQSVLLEGADGPAFDPKAGGAAKYV